MGAYPSNLNQLISAKLTNQVKAIPPPAPDPRADAERLRIELNMAKNDVNSKQAQYDKLVPEEANTRKTVIAQKEIGTYVGTKQKQFDTELKLYNVLLDQVNTLANNGVVGVAKKYKEELKKKQMLMRNKTTENKEKAFTNRRRIIDSDPQKPLTGFLSFESVDAQVMLAFWISYILALCTLMLVVISKYGKFMGSTKNIAIFFIVFIIAMVVIAHLLIQAVATRQ